MNIIHHCSFWIQQKKGIQLWRNQAMSGWSGALEDEFKVTQELSIEADECRSISTHRDSPGPSGADSPVASWWASVLFQAGKLLGYGKPKWLEDPIKVVSGCTGCSAESAALKVGCVEMLTRQISNFFNVGLFYRQVAVVK